MSDGINLFTTTSNIYSNNSSLFATNSSSNNGETTFTKNVQDEEGGEQRERYKELMAVCNKFFAEIQFGGYNHNTTTTTSSSHFEDVETSSSSGHSSNNNDHFYQHLFEEQTSNEFQKKYFLNESELFPFMFNNSTSSFASLDPSNTATNKTYSFMFSMCNNLTMSGTTDATSLADEDTYYGLPWWRQLIWSVLFVTMATTATCGNLIVIWIVLWHQRMRTVTNYFIVNLSIADTMVSSLNVTFNFVYMLNGHWPFGNIYCKLCSYISIISVCGSVFTLVAISADRYNAIIRPLKPRMGRPMTIMVAAMIWFVALLIGLPFLLFFQTHKQPDGCIENCTLACYPVWPDGKTNESPTEFVYNVAFMIMTYFLPMAMMSCTYAAIGRELWGQRAIGEATAAQKEGIRSKRRVVKMMVMVVVIFGICWLPYHTYFIWSNIDPTINLSEHIQEIYLAIYWLAMSNSMYNPMIYCFMNNRFRQGFRRVFRFFFPCCLKYCQTGSSANTVRGRLGGLDDNTLAPQTATQYNHSCQEVHRNIGKSKQSNTMNLPDKSRKYLSTKNCTSTSSLSTSMVKSIDHSKSNGNKNRYRISKRANHLQNGGQRLIKGESEVSIAKSNSVNLLDDSKCPDKTLEKCDVEKDESTILIENTLNGALNLTVNDCAKKAVNLNESHVENFRFRSEDESILQVSSLVAKHSTSQSYNTRKDQQNVVINQMDTCQQHIDDDNKQQEIELKMLVNNNKKEEEEEEEEIEEVVNRITTKVTSDVCGSVTNTAENKKACDGKDVSNTDYIVGGSGEGQKCVLSISTKNRDTTGSNNDDSESKSSSNGEEEEVILLMKNPDIIRHSISATNFTLASLGFHNEAYHTYSSPVGGTSNNTKTNNVPDQEKMIQGVFVQRGPPKAIGSKKYSGPQEQTFL